MNSRIGKHICTRAWIALALGAAASPAWAQPSTGPAEIPVPKLSIDPRDAFKAPGNDLTDLSLEDLMNIRVTTASKQGQRLSDVAAAISVITADDIHRTRYQNIPDLLRTVPGVFVGQIGSSTWSVGSREGAGRYTPNLLVMMDGRSVYTPDFSGVYWMTVDYVMPDIDRIEVIRGPGATLWGANAVNGVINIISKEAKDTQGFLIDSYAGTDGFINSVRYGGKINEDIYFRVYGKSRGMGDFDFHDGSNASDGWDQYRSGFRMDIQLNPADKVTVQGDIFEGRNGGNAPMFVSSPPYKLINSGPFNISGGNVLARYTHTFSETSDLTVQMYYDTFNNGLALNVGAGGFSRTVDLDLQHRFALGDSQEVIWGGDYRFTADSLDASPPVVPYSTARTLQIGSGFIQDDFAIIPEHLHVIAGAKLEYDSIVGTAELQPSIRGIWTPDGKNTFWASVSRAARTPGLNERLDDLGLTRVPIGGGKTLDIHLEPNPTIGSEHTMAYEAGYRLQPVKSYSLDISGYYDVTDHAREVDALPVAFQNGHLVQPLEYVDNQIAQTWGGEIASTWEISDKWKVIGSYSYLNSHHYRGTAPTFLNGDPQHQIKLRTYYDITKDLDISSELYWTGPIKDERIPAYFRWDVSLAWRPEKHTELSIGVRNILQSGHTESLDYTVSTVPAIDIPRTFFVQLELKF